VSTTHFKTAPDTVITVPLCPPLTSRLPRTRCSAKHFGTENNKFRLIESTAMP